MNSRHCPFSQLAELGKEPGSDQMLGPEGGRRLEPNFVAGVSQGPVLMDTPQEGWVQAGDGVVKEAGPRQERSAADDQTA